MSETPAMMLGFVEATDEEPLGQAPEHVKLNGHDFVHVAACPCQPKPEREDELPAGFDQLPLPGTVES